MKSPVRWRRRTAGSPLSARKPTCRPAGTRRETVKLDGRWITPGLIDCHTHIVYGGDRAHEFELRLKGASYEEIARAGGGIVSTVKATRAASEDAAGRAVAEAARCAAGRRRHHHRNQVGLRPRSRQRDQDAAGGAQAWPRARCRCGDDISRRACPAAGGNRQGRFHRQGLRHDPADQAGRPGRRRGCLLRGHRVFARNRPHAFSTRPRRADCR